MEKSDGNFSLTPYQVIGTVFCVIVIVSNIISAKMVTVPFIKGIAFPAGLLTYPLTFLLGDLVTEIYGAKLAKRMVYITLGMNILTFGILQMALWLPAESVTDNKAFQSVLGSSGLRIFSSLIAYSIAQLLDIQLYASIKKWTGLRFLWIRANGSTWFSQVIDTVLIDLIFLYWGLGISFQALILVIGFSLAYKMLFSVIATPFLYLLVFLIRNKMKRIKKMFRILND